MAEEKEQITINVRSDVAEYIRNRSEEIGGSNQYMGEVVENLVDGKQFNQGAILDRLDEIEEKLDEDSPRNTSTHTTSSSNSIPEEIQQKLDSEEEIDPEEHDLEQLKGSGKVLDVAELVVKNESGMTEEEIEELFSSKFGYSVNSTRQKRKSLMNRLVEFKIEDSVISGWMDKEIEEWEWHKLGKTGNKIISPHKNVENKKEWYRQEHGGDVNSYLHLDRHNRSINPVYTHSETIDKQETILRSRLEHIVNQEDNELIEDRFNRVISYLK